MLHAAPLRIGIESRYAARVVALFQDASGGSYLEIPPASGLEVCGLGHGERGREARKKVAVVLAIGCALKASCSSIEPWDITPS